MRRLLLFLILLFYGTAAQAQWWEVQTSGIDTNLRGVSAVFFQNAQGKPAPVVWVSGSNGAILKSVDQGKTWERLHVADGDTLDFRGIVAFSDSTAYVMASGDGEKSRIFKTADGGASWKLQYSDTRKEFFLDSIACFSEKECIALGDPVNGKFLLLKTSDGENWNPLPTDQMPAALGGEGGFAASNSCLALSGDKEIFFGTGGATARVFHSTDGGLTWTAAKTPLVQGNPSSGIFGLQLGENKTLVLQLGENKTLVAIGGDYKDSIYNERVAAYSTDKGKTWELAARQPGGFRSALAHIDGGRWVAVGPTGGDFSEDNGAHWKHTDSQNFNAAFLLNPHIGWAVGPKGTIARFIDHTAKKRHTPEK